ncbi:MAG: hypothetical protein AAGH68_05780 [Pseudomonadota bacterium]
MNQRINAHDWHSLGVFSYEDVDPLVVISTVGANSTHVVADAILFERVETDLVYDLIL